MLVQYCYLRFGIEKTVEMLDSLKNLGFSYATRSGLSIGIDDLIIPEEKKALVETARKEVIRVEQQYLEGAITNGERYNKVIAIWSEATESISEEMFDEMKDRDRAGRSTPSTSWRTPARAAASSRSASSPACAA